MTTPNRDEALEAAAEKYAESHDPHCKWLHCPARLDAIKFFTAGAEFERGRTGGAAFERDRRELKRAQDRIAKLEADLTEAIDLGKIAMNHLDPRQAQDVERLQKLEAVVSAAEKFRDQMTCYSTGCSVLVEEDMRHLDDELIRCLAVARVDAQEKQG